MSTNQLIREREAVLHEYARPWSEGQPTPCIDPFMRTVTKAVSGYAWMPHTHFLKMSKLGGAEGIGLSMRFRKMDKPNPTPEELKEGLQDVEASVQDALNYLVNCGVVGALLMSISIPLLISPVSVDEDAVADLSPSTVKGARIAYLALIGSAAAASIELTYLSLRLYTYLSTWLPTPTARAWCLKNMDPAQLVAKSVASFTLTILSAVPAVLLGYGKWHCIGFAACLTCFIFKTFGFDEAGRATKLLVYQHSILRELLAQESGGRVEVRPPSLGHIAKNGVVPTA